MLHALTVKLFEGIDAHPAERGLLLPEGTMLDATFIAATPLTKNEEHERQEQEGQRLAF